jgi:hypothetical protein
MPTKGPSEQQEEERNIELENTVGNLMVAEYQVDRLRTRLSDNIRTSNILKTGSGTNGKGSTHVFKHNNKWYKVSVKVEELMVDIRQDMKGQDDGVLWS